MAVRLAGGHLRFVLCDSNCVTEKRRLVCGYISLQCYGGCSPSGKQVTINSVKHM